MGKCKSKEGTRVYLEKGDTVILQKLIQGMLINSGNDAGIAITEYLSGSYNVTTKLYITQSTQSNVLITLKDDGEFEMLYPSERLLFDIC